MEGIVFLRAWPSIVNTYFFRYNVLEPLSPASELERFSPKIPVIVISLANSVLQRPPV